MGKNWIFHVRHNAKPSIVIEVLLILQGQVHIDINRMLQIGEERGYTIGTTAKSAQSVKENPVQVAQDLGLVQPETFVLTSLGEVSIALYQAKPKIIKEFLHFLNYSIWDPSRPEKQCSSWSYKVVCDMLWERGSVQVERQQMASWLDEMAHTQFNINRTSLSKDSISGILNWLWELDPLVLEKRKRNEIFFSRRAFCPPEIFVLAVDHIYRRYDVRYQTNMLLDPSKQEEICKVCLLDPDGFENALEWACGQYEFLSQGSSGGWGRYLVLARSPTLNDFMG